MARTEVRIELLAQVFAIDDYYAANGQVAWLTSEGESAASIGTHAGIRETSELLAIDPAAVRQECPSSKYLRHGGS